MECPYCSYENIDGADQCGRCQADLMSMDRPGESSDLERTLLQTPLSEVSTQDYAVVAPSVSVRETLSRWSASGHHCAMVVENDHLVGVFTERDVLNKIAGNFESHADKPVSAFMSADPESLDQRVPIAFGLNRMMVGGYRHVPVLNRGALAGVVSVRDILAFLAKHLTESGQ